MEKVKVTKGQKEREREREIAPHFKRQQIDTSKLFGMQIEPVPLNIAHSTAHCKQQRVKERTKETWKTERVLNYCQVK